MEGSDGLNTCLGSFSASERPPRRTARSHLQSWCLVHHWPYQASCSPHRRPLWRMWWKPCVARSLWRPGLSPTPRLHPASRLCSEQSLCTWGKAGRCRLYLPCTRDYIGSWTGGRNSSSWRLEASPRSSVWIGWSLTSGQLQFPQLLLPREVVPRDLVQWSPSSHPLRPPLGGPLWRIESGSCAEGNPGPIDDDYINVFPDLLCQLIVCAHWIKSYHATWTYIIASCYTDNIYWQVWSRGPTWGLSLQIRWNQQKMHLMPVLRNCNYLLRLRFRFRFRFRLRI